MSIPDGRIAQTKNACHYFSNVGISSKPRIQMNVFNQPSAPPRLSIITVNLNNRDGLERTLTSVQAQRSFSSYEHIVVDGGSVDGSLKIIRRNEGRLARWISEPDRGIYHAMNKGTALARGEYLLFLNSGDCLANENVLHTVISNFPDADIVYGSILVVRNGQPAGQTISPNPENLSLSFWIQNTIQHSGTFIRRKLLLECGYAEDFRIVADRKFFFEAFLAGKTYARLDCNVTRFELGGISSDPHHATLRRAEWNRLFTQHMSAPVLARIREEIARREKENYVLFRKRLPTICESPALQELLGRWIDLFFLFHRFRPTRASLSAFAALLRRRERCKKRTTDPTSLPDDES